MAVDGRVFASLSLTEGKRNEREKKLAVLPSRHTVLLFESLAIPTKLLLAKSQFSHNRTTQSREVTQIPAVPSHFQSSK